MLHIVLWFVLLTLLSPSLPPLIFLYMPHHHLLPVHFSSSFLLPSTSSSLVLSHLSVLTGPRVPSRSSFLPLSPQVDSMDNFTPSNTPSREDDPKSHLKSRSRSPSMASDMEPIEVRTSLSLGQETHMFSEWMWIVVGCNFPSGCHQLEILIRSLPVKHLYLWHVDNQGGKNALNTNLIDNFQWKFSQKWYSQRVTILSLSNRSAVVNCR